MVRRNLGQLRLPSKTMSHVKQNKTKKRSKEVSGFMTYSKAGISIKQMQGHRQRYENKDCWVRMLMGKMKGDSWGDEN